MTRLDRDLTSAAELLARARGLLASASSLPDEGLLECLATMDEAYARMDHQVTLGEMAPDRREVAATLSEARKLADRALAAAIRSRPPGIVRVGEAWFTLDRDGLAMFRVPGRMKDPRDERAIAALVEAAARARVGGAA